MNSDERIRCRSLRRALAAQAGTVLEQGQDCHRFVRKAVESYPH